MLNKFLKVRKHCSYWASSKKCFSINMASYAIKTFYWSTKCTVRYTSTFLGVYQRLHFLNVCGFTAGIYMIVIMMKRVWRVMPLLDWLETKNNSAFHDPYQSILVNIILVSEWFMTKSGILSCSNPTSKLQPRTDLGSVKWKFQTWLI